MILLDNEKDKHIAIKTNQPKFKNNKTYWDSTIKTINDKKCNFFFTTMSNRSWLYFQYQEQWYKVNMSNKDGVDLLYNVKELFIEN